MLNKEKVVAVVTDMNGETIIDMIASVKQCPSRYKLNDSNCDFVDCKVCWERALRATSQTREIIK